LGHLSILGIQWGTWCWILVFCVVFCRSLFIILTFFSFTIVLCVFLPISLFLQILKVALSCWNYSCCFYYNLIFTLCIYLLYLFILFLRFVLFVQSLVFCSVFCGPLFVLLSFCFVCYSKTNNFWLQFVLWCFNATFNKFSVLSWRSVLLVEETGGQGEKQLNFLCTSFQSSKVFES
jgi:hypothetical protein